MLMVKVSMLDNTPLASKPHQARNTLMGYTVFDFVYIADWIMKFRQHPRKALLSKTVFLSLYMMIK